MAERLTNLEKLETRTQAIGRELLDRAGALAPSVLNPQWWDEHVMQWSMTAEHLKGRLFRLVDVLPALPDRDSVLAHLKEYLGDGTDLSHQAGHEGQSSAETDTGLGEPPASFRSRLETHLIHLIPPLLGSSRSIRGRLSAAAVLRSVRRLARRFVAGATAEEAAQTILALRARRLAFSLDLLGEKVLSEREADEYAGRYIELIESLTAASAGWPADPLLDRGEGEGPAGGPADSPGRPIPRVNLSIKLSSLDSQFDPLAPRRSADAVLARLRPILRAARQRGAFIHVDMEHYEVKDLTLALFERVAAEDEFADWRDLGIVLQAYLKDSPADLDRLLALARRRGTPFTVRLVKGAYWDYENVIAAQRNWPVPVFAHKHETDANFERLTRRLLAGGGDSPGLDPAIASHNVRSLAQAIATSEALALPAGRIEFQMLYGMGDPIKAALVERGWRVRIYAPFGELIPGMAYLIRRLLENTSNESFLRQSFVDHAGADRLLANPETDSGSIPNSESPIPHVFRNAPDTDFAKEANRMQMDQAIQRVRSQLGTEIELIISGCGVAGERIVDRENPASPSEVVARVHFAGKAQADQAVAAAEEARRTWAEVPTARRAELLEKFADAIESHRYELAAWEVLETAKQWREADADVSEAIDYCRYYASQAIELMDRPRRRDVSGESNIYRYLPRGVGAVIAPWNFPLAILAGMSTAAVAAGNAVILKPAEQSSAVAARFAALITSAGIPPGVFNFLPGEGETIGDYLVCHPGVDFIAFTGSRQVGTTIYAHAASTPARGGPKHVVCEMGGKNAILVDGDADLDDAVRGTIVSAFGYNGQKCSACSRAIVVGEVYPRFVQRLVEAARSLTIGPPQQAEHFMGPLIDRNALAKVRRYIEIGRSEGRCALETDVSSLGDGYYVGPTIFADVPPTARIAREEIFGPVLAVIRASDFDEALQIANGTDFALTGGLYSRSPGHIQRARSEFRVGNLYINRKITGALVDRQPFGGFGFSGLGSKAGGPDYLLQFVLPQTVTENTLRHGWAPQSPCT